MTIKFLLGTLFMTTGIADFALAQARKALNGAMKFHSEGKLEDAGEHYRRVLEYRYRVPDARLAAACWGGPLISKSRAAKWRSPVGKRLPRAVKRRTHGVAGLMEKGAILQRARARSAGLRAVPADASKTATGVISGKISVAPNNLAVALVQANRGFSDALETLPQAVARSSVPGQASWEKALCRRTDLQDRSLLAYSHVERRSPQRCLRGGDCEGCCGTGRKREFSISAPVGGLMSMMAARAGATNIVTSRSGPGHRPRPPNELLRGTDLGNRIAVVNKMSTELAVGQDMETRADILVSEILSSDLLAEDVLSTFEDAHARLINEGATIIPRAATAVGCLVESEVLSKYSFVGNVSGFDVSNFAARRKPASRSAAR